MSKTELTAVLRRSMLPSKPTHDSHEASWGWNRWTMPYVRWTHTAAKPSTAERDGIGIFVQACICCAMTVAHSSSLVL